MRLRARINALLKYEAPIHRTLEGLFFWPNPRLRTPTMSGARCSADWRVSGRGKGIGHRRAAPQFPF
jgi:hypothetical protein